MIPYQACSAQIGSTSVTYTMAPRPFSDAQQPLPTCKHRTIITM